MVLDYVALALLVLVALVLFYGIIAIHDIPYEIAVRRNHPHQDALHVAGWVSLFTLHAIWPLLWIWATLYRPDRGWGFGPPAAREDTAPDEIAALHSAVEQLDAQVSVLRCRAEALEERLAEVTTTVPEPIEATPEPAEASRLPTRPSPADEPVR